MVATILIPRTPFGLPRVRRRRPARRSAPFRLTLLAWTAILLAAVAMGWRAVRWADRNL